jgi:hypothetical protein
MYVRLSNWNGERGHVARCLRHFAANATRTYGRENDFCVGSHGGCVRQHAGRCEQNARAPQIRDAT